MKFKTIIALALLGLAAPAFGASTVNPNIPATNAPLQSAPIRGNFTATYNDINSLLSKFAATIAPSQPTTFQDWFDVSGGQPKSWKVYDGSQWVTIGFLDTSTHTWTTGGGAAPGGPAGGDLGGSYPNPTVLNVSHVASGTLNVVNGGTGITSGTSGGIPFFTSSSTMSSSLSLVQNGFVIGGGAGVAPQTVQLTGLVLGNGTSAPTAYAGTSGSTHQFLTALSAAGAGTFAQPAFTDISGTIATGQVSGSYTGITAVGTIATGVWNGTALTSTYLPATVVYSNANQSFTAAQRSTPAVLSISTSTFTPNFDTGQNFSFTLVHASCPCTFANPSTTPVAGQSGVMEIVQSATGSDTVGTWGSNYTAAGGTSTITLSTAANARDYISYYVADSTHIVLSLGVANASH